MRNKSELYKKEQEEILKKILKIIGINNEKIRINREELLKEEIENELKEMEEEIKKYYSVSKFKSYINGDEKYLNLIKNICKEKEINILKLQGKRYKNKEEKTRETYVIYQFELNEKIKELIKE
jgi:hypothetical protein